MADDIAGLLRGARHRASRLLGYSLGGGVALQTAIRHPARVRKLVVVASPFAARLVSRSKEAFQHVGRALAEPMRPSPVYQTYAAVAPRPEQFPQLLDKMGELQRRGYDWSPDMARLAMPAMLVFADADSLPPAHIVRFFELLGGGQRDAGWDGSAAPRARLPSCPARRTTTSSIRGRWSARSSRFSTPMIRLGRTARRPLQNDRRRLFAGAESQ